MTFGFGTPWLLLLLLLIPALGTMSIWARTWTLPAGLRYSHTSLATVSVSSWRITLRPALLGLRLLALALMIAGAARPQLGEVREIIKGEGVDIAIAIDISSSMASLDFDPGNRLEAAKQVVNDFVEERKYDRIGLVVFAREAFVQSPPSIDHKVLLRLLDDIELATDLRIEDGTAIGLGLATAANMMKDSAAKSKIITLITDGANNAGEIDPLTAATAAKALGIKVYTIGAGDPGLVPVLVQTPFGEQLIGRQSDLDEETLRQIADATGGKYFRATDTEGLQQIYGEINALEKSEVEVRVFTSYHELAGWLLAPALLLLVADLVLRHTVFRKIP